MDENRTQPIQRSSNLRNAEIYKESESDIAFGQMLSTYKRDEEIANSTAIYNYLGGATLGLSSVIASPFITDSYKKEMFNYEVKHPLQTALQEGAGVLTTSLFTGGLGLAKAAGTVGTVARAYETLVGIGEAKTFADAAKMWAIGGATMSAVNMVDTASLDPVFVSNNMGKYAGDILESSLFGGALGLATKGVGRSWAKYVRGEEFFEEAAIPTTNKERELLGTRMARAYTPYIGADGKFNEFANASRDGMQFKNNITFLNKKEASMIRDAERVSKRKGASVNMEDYMFAHFIAELHGSEELSVLASKGKVNVPEIYNNWKRMVALEMEEGASRATATDTQEAIKGSLIRSVEENASQDFDKLMVETRKEVEESLNAATDDYFNHMGNSLKITPNLAKLTNPDGLLKKIQNRIEMVKSPEKFMDPAKYTKDEIAAARKLAEIVNEDPKLLRELEANFDVFRASVAESPERTHISTVGKIKFGRKTMESSPASIERTWITKKDLTPRAAYDSMQKFRQDFNKRAYDIQRKLSDRGVIDNPAVNQLWGEIKQDLFSGMEDIFGDFGKTAARKSQLLNVIGDQEREILLNLSGGEMRKLPAVWEETSRTNVINKLWRNLDKVGVDANTEFQPDKVRGWLGNAKDEISKAFRELQEILPNEKIGDLHMRSNEFFDRQGKLVDDIRITNDPHMESLFKSAVKFEKKAAEKGPGGRSIRSHLTAALYDFAKAPLNPQDLKFGLTQILGALLNGGTTLGKRFLKSKEIQRETAKEILYGTLKNISDLSVERTKFVNSIRSMSAAVFSGETVDRIAGGIRNQLVSYSSRADTYKDIEEINTKFDKISKNIEAMRADPTMYVQRIDYVVGSLRVVSPEIADASIDKILQQIALVSQIMPEKPDGIYYKKEIPLSDKARFIDNFEALTDPGKMIEKMKYATITSDQLRILETSYPDIWEKTVSQVRTDLYLKNPSQEARTRVYSMFGIQDTETLSKSQDMAKEMLMRQFEAEHPNKVPKVRQPRVKSLSSRSSNLTPQGMKN